MMQVLAWVAAGIFLYSPTNVTTDVSAPFASEKACLEFVVKFDEYLQHKPEIVAYGVGCVQVAVNPNELPNVKPDVPKFVPKDGPKT
jgi:hypothetical protein